jgi:hypothetical protein
MFQLKAVEKIEIHILYAITFSQNHAVYEILSKHMGEPEATDDNTVDAHCMLDKYGYTCARSHAHVRLPTHMHAQVRTRAHTEICNTHGLSTATMIS